MLASDNIRFGAAAIQDPDDITIDTLLGLLSAHADKSLVFSCDGNALRPGYHVTEVKAGRFDALDCGANPESWTEVFVQLWDANEDRPHLQAGKFTAIIGKVTQHVGLDHAARLTFEVSDGVRPIGLYRAALPRIVAGAVQVELSPRPASCKPRDRWLEDQRKAAQACCSTSAQTKSGCC